MNPVLVNGDAYSWAQLTILIGSNILAGINKITFSRDVDYVNNYGVGMEPVSRGVGNAKYSGSMSLHLDDMKRLQAISPDGTLTGLPKFTIKLVYGNPIAPTTDTLFNVQFTKDGNTLNQGDTVFVEDIPFIHAGQKRA